MLETQQIIPLMTLAVLFGFLLADLFNDREKRVTDAYWRGRDDGRKVGYQFGVCDGYQDSYKARTLKDVAVNHDDIPLIVAARHAKKDRSVVNS